MPSKDKRGRVERGLYRIGSYYHACATPPGSRTVIWRALGQVGLMEARRLRDKFAAEVHGAQPLVARTRATFGELAAEWLAEQRAPGGRRDVAAHLRVYEMALRRHVLPVFQSRQVRAIAVEQLVDWIPSSARWIRCAGRCRARGHRGGAGACRRARRRPASRSSTSCHDAADRRAPGGLLDSSIEERSGPRPALAAATGAIAGPQMATPQPETATAEVREIFADIQATYGARFVASLFRALAASGDLGPAWRVARPFQRSPRGRELADALSALAVRTIRDKLAWGFAGPRAVASMGAPSPGPSALLGHYRLALPPTLAFVTMSLTSPLPQA